jgi:hypothetical protein
MGFILSGLEDCGWSKGTFIHDGYGTYVKNRALHPIFVPAVVSLVFCRSARLLIKL